MPVTVRLATEDDLPAFLRLAGPVEPWFGPMVEDPAFHEAVRRHARRGHALLTTDGTGGLLFGIRERAYHLDWLVVAAPARGTGVGRALVRAAVSRFVSEPWPLEVVTFGAGHRGAAPARAFYERLGFEPAELAGPGPEGGPRQVYRLRTPSASGD
jgi:GNAT superfamily N-acetyltransferase